MANDPKPGTHEATQLGCLCAVMDNARGKGRFGDGEKYGWWMTQGCPVHWPSKEEAAGE